MTAPYIPLYIDDLDAAIAHLTLQEEAIYMRLMKMAWRTVNCSIANDIDFVSRKIRAGKNETQAILEEFFILKNNKWVQKRLKTEFDKYKNKISERKKAGKIGGINNALKNNNKKVDFATAKSSKPEPEPEPEPEPNTIDKSIVADKEKKPPDRGKRLSEDWQPTEANIQDAQKLGLTQTEIENEARRFRDYWVSKAGADAAKRDWNATWRNWCDSPQRGFSRKNGGASGGNAFGGKHQATGSRLGTITRLIRESEERGYSG